MMQKIENLRGEAAFLAVLLVEFFRVVMKQREDIFFALTHRRHRDGQDVEAVIQVVSEFPCPDEVRELQIVGQLADFIEKERALVRAGSSNAPRPQRYSTTRRKSDGEDHSLFCWNKKEHEMSTFLTR